MTATAPSLRGLRMTRSSCPGFVAEFKIRKLNLDPFSRWAKLPARTRAQISHHFFLLRSSGDGNLGARALLHGEQHFRQSRFVALDRQQSVAKGNFDRQLRRDVPLNPLRSREVGIDQTRSRRRRSRKIMQTAGCIPSSVAPAP